MNDKIGKYFLDLNKLHKLEDKEERQQIHGYYKDMLYAFGDGRNDMAESIKWTLINSGYLLNNEQITRDLKINSVLNGD
jgi:hypothetical protein